MQQQCKTPRCSSAETTMMPGVAVRFRSTLKAKELQLQREIPAGGFAFKLPKVLLCSHYGLRVHGGCNLYCKERH